MVLHNYFPIGLFTEKSMRYLLFLSLLLSSVANAQLSQKQLQEMQDNARKMDSVTRKMNESINESIRRMDSLNMIETNKQMTRNMDAFMAERKVQEKKAKQRMYLRLGFGILMLVVLVIGLRRKKKNQV
ncbi:hypothetical protein LK994_00685 [Ferruginibacter lapsinanis]|uniref:hypothetical protein n=1 Tax=Ferruginibacter lapsinanis TaxID=563172 RepID=UPI001E41D22A|nr:hypothetical protein [Ferruginibacter lapsinanis]UEG49988.1 hypothetical protein LK994_00685 [Ferruginibacter lapsinanis]